MHFQIVFNLYPFQENLYLPAANIVQLDKGGELAHIRQKANPETVVPYSIKVTSVLDGLFNILDNLHPKNIEARFKAPKAKTPTPLAQLLENKDTKHSVEGFIYRELDTFLTEIVRNGLPLTLDAEKKSLVKDVLITLAKEELVPHLHFKKTPTGVEYRLQLGTDDERWPIRERSVLPLTNTSPAWVLVGYALFRVPGINGNMLKPFQKKDLLEIPAKNVREYFQKIIVKNANRTHIEPEGFELTVHDRLLGCQLHLTEDIFRRSWILSPLFRYEGREVDPWEKRQQFTWVEFPGNEAVELIQVRRDKALETEKLNFLKNMGLLVENRSFSIPKTDAESPDLHAYVLWLSENEAMLAAAGFQVATPAQNGKTIAIAEGRIRWRSSVRDDWFDVHGTVVIGKFEFPFKKFVPYIRRGDLHFPLPDGTFFLIPEEWMARYAEFARAAQDGADDALRLPKTLFSLLQSLGIETEGAEMPVIDPESIEYDPTETLRATLRPYQLHGVKWLIGHQKHGFGACLADDMGLGKTLQTIAVLLYAKENKEKQATTVIPPLIPQAPIVAADPSNNTSTQKEIIPSKKPAKKQVALQLDLFAPPITITTPIQPSNNTTIQPSNHTTNHPTFTALIILPASLVFNWRAELEKFAPSLFVCVHVGAKRLSDVRALAYHHIVLTTYHTARNDLALLSQVEWDYIILDESQQIKNKDSEISKVVRGLEADNRISLSGTPIENSLADLWAQMEFINPQTLGSFADFKKHFLLPIERGGDATAKESLFRRIRPFFLRRTKEEVAPDLPALGEQVFYSEMAADQRKLYEKTKAAVRNEILSLWDDPTKRLLAIQALTRLRQLANHPALMDADYGGDSGKFDDVLAQWETIRRSGHKVLVFSSFETHLQLFRRVFEAEKTPYAWLTGQTEQKKRKAEVERFQSDPAVQVFFMTTKAGGVGLNLTAADYVFILDPWWNPAVESQAVARAHRIGQQHPVTAIRFIARETIEEKIREMQVRKQLMGQEFFAAGAEDTPMMSRADLEDLLA